MSCNEEQQIDNLDGPENRISSVSNQICRDNKEIRNKEEGAEMRTMPFSSSAYTDVPPSAESPQINDSELYSHPSKDTYLRHRMNTNIIDNAGCLDGHEKICSEISTSPKDEEPSSSTHKYLQIYTNQSFPDFSKQTFMFQLVPNSNMYK